jgi:hypothetical protein
VDPIRWEQRLEPPPPEAVEAAVLYLIQDSQKEINLKDIESLLPEISVADPGCFIPDPGSGSHHCSIPDPDPGSRIRGVKKHRIPDPGSDLY